MSELRIVSHTSEAFENRPEAGRLLAGHLGRYRSRNAVVLGIPRGGIIVAQELARALDAELDIVLARKLRAPFNTELAIGSVSEHGEAYVNKGLVSELGIGQGYIREEKERQLAEVSERIERYRRVRPKVPLKGRIAIVTDDGIATGSTMQAALWAVAGERPGRLIAAIPVSPRDTLAELSGICDEVLCLRTPDFFAAVGQFYLSFNQVSDEEVVEVLKSAALDYSVV